jgi:hypothetical protein
MTELRKGAYKGLCNRSSCLKPGADWWHYGNRAYYCHECAVMLNKANCPSGLNLLIAPSSMPPNQSAALAARDAEIARLKGIVSSQAHEIRALGEALSGMTSLVNGTGFADSPEFDRAMAAFEFIGTSDGEPILPDAPILADARRWWMLPAFIEDFQIDYVGLKRAIDAELFGQYCSIGLSQPSAPEQPASAPAAQGEPAQVVLIDLCREMVALHEKHDGLVLRAHIDQMAELLAAAPKEPNHD